MNTIRERMHMSDATGDLRRSAATLQRIADRAADAIYSHDPITADALQAGADALKAALDRFTADLGECTADQRNALTRQYARLRIKQRFRDISGELSELPPAERETRLHMLEEITNLSDTEAMRRLNTQ